MSYIFYVLGVIGLVLAGYIFTNGVSTNAGSLGSAVAFAYSGSIFVGAMSFFAVGRILDHLAEIARNSRDLRYLERLDPAIAARLDQRAADRAERGWFGLGPKKQPAQDAQVEPQL